MPYDPESSAVEVAEDFKSALEDMTTVLRVEIMNLCQIAKENTEHAYEISEVLQSHILKAPPQRKLPALYVLDAIVKNVGTPYTLYLAPKLYSTFMESYATVDTPVRRKLEEMLKTWKQPVPGSIDTRPVFPLDVVTPIETALMKARASAIQAQEHLRGQQQYLRPRSALQARDTPTPPGVASHRGPPVPQNGGRGEAFPAHQVPFMPQRAIQTPASNTNQGAFPPHERRAGSVPAGGISIDALNRDVHGLVVATQAELARGRDASIETRLKALQALQAILQAGNLPQEQLVLVKKQVDDLAVTMRVSPSQTSTPTPVSHYVQAPPPSHPLHHIAGNVAALPPQPNSQPQAPITLDSILGPGALATLLGRAPAIPQASTPASQVPALTTRSPPPQPPLSRRTPPPTQAPKGPGATDPMALINQLRQAGLLQQGPAGPASGATPAPSLPSTQIHHAPPGLPPVLANLLPSLKGQARQPLGEINDLGLNSASLKQQYQHHLVPLLYENLGAPCSQCGRRFNANEEGRKKKMAHMDWHFRVHQRMTEAEKRGQHRSWYVDRQDWVKSRETIDVDYIHSTDETTSGTTGSSATKAPKLEYILVPDPSRGINNVCPICQEKFENKWLDAAQEWVWLDAVLVGGRAYHVSCHEDAARDRDRAGTPGYGGGVFGRATPEPVPLLGKRKAEQTGGVSYGVKKQQY